MTARLTDVQALAATTLLLAARAAHEGRLTDRRALEILRDAGAALAEAAAESPALRLVNDDSGGRRP